MIPARTEPQRRELVETGLGTLPVIGVIKDCEPTAAGWRGVRPNLPELPRRRIGGGRLGADDHPADLQVEVPTRFELIVNLKAAKMIGLAIPDSFLSVANEIIE